MLTRNNDIDRRIKANREYADLLPEGVSPDVFSKNLIEQRSASASIIGTPRGGPESAPPSERGSAASNRASAEIASARSSSVKEEISGFVAAMPPTSARDSAPEPPPPAASPPPLEPPPAAPPLSLPSIDAPGDLESAIAALTLEKDKVRRLAGCTGGSVDVRGKGPAGLLCARVVMSVRLSHRDKTRNRLETTPLTLQQAFHAYTTPRPPPWTQAMAKLEAEFAAKKEALMAQLNPVDVA